MQDDWAMSREGQRECLIRELVEACKVALEYLAPVCISSQAVPNMLRAVIAKAERTP